MTFVDLFAGLGGFHVALKRLGHQCVFACESDHVLRDLYQANFGLSPAGDIRSVDLKAIPSHDILCAGFPCQPFSKAGEQSGLSCPKWGDLFDYVMEVIRLHEPQYVILENVPNLARHRGGQTYQQLRRRLEEHYEIDEARLSPHQFGIPQIRDRLFIAGSRSGLHHFGWPEPTGVEPSLRAALEASPPDARPLPDHVVRCIEAWQRFLDLFPKDEELPSFPIWAMEFGADYPYEDVTPHAVGPEHLGACLGSFGKRLGDMPSDERLAALPSYARTQTERFPQWKITYIRQNRDFYKRHKGWLDAWLPELRPFPASRQKLEWNCKGEERRIWDYVLQLRASGVRVKRPTTAPSLVAMTTTQVPIIGWERRYMTPGECARLQSMESLTLPRASSRAFKALGNAVNVDLVGRIAGSLLSERGHTGDPGTRAYRCLAAD